MTRSYISTITSVKEWKQETVSTLSDLSKDVHGTRWLPYEVTAPDATMEDILDFYAYCLGQLAEQYEDEKPFVYEPVMFVNHMSF